MTDGMFVELGELDTMAKSLKSFIDEFENLGDTNGDLMDAIGRPADRSGLRGRVDDFEDEWDGNRETITDSLNNVHDHIADFVKGVRDGDIQLSGGTGGGN